MFFSRRPEFLIETTYDDQFVNSVLLVADFGILASVF